MKETPASLYLIWGDEYLARKAADELVARLLPGDTSGLSLSTLDGASPREVAADLATMPLFPGQKVVLVRDPDFIAPKKGRGDPLGKAKEAWRAGRHKEGARRLLALAARAGWNVNQLDPSASGAPSVSDWSDELGVELAEADLTFLKEVATFCRENRISAPEGDVTPLLDLYAKGVPEGHSLVMVATDVDAKNPLVKLAAQKGQVLEKKVASRHKDLDISEVAAEVLKPLGKKMGPGALERLKDRVGGNMRLLHSELAKLAAYTDGPQISATDVDLLVSHAREEEFFELSEALQKRNMPQALSYVTNAIAQGSHPLLLLGAVASCVRNLIDGHERFERLAKGSVPRSYQDFQSRLFPAIEKEAQETKGRAPHPYAAFLALQAAARYSRAELLGALVACADADVALKSSAVGERVIERLIWTVCGTLSLQARRQ